MFALDRFLRVTGSAGSHYDKQTYAHLGVKIPDGLNGECYRVGSHSFDLQIADVVATSSTTAEGVGSVIGDVAGKGFASGSNGMPTFSFTAPESGVLIGIFSIEPKPDYHGVDIANYWTNTYDFYHSEFENLGYAPLYRSEFTGIFGDTSSLLPDVWTYRYSNLKTKVNVVSESMYATDKSIWQGNRMDFSFLNGTQLSINSLLYINPQYCNNIFAMQVPRYPTVPNADSAPSGALKLSKRSFDDDALTPASVYSSDNFIVNAFTKCYKTSIMSVHSLPKMM